MLGHKHFELGRLRLKVRFVVCLETAPSAEKVWEIGIWHNLAEDSQWEHLALAEDTSSKSEV